MPKYNLQKYEIPTPKEFETPVEETLVIAPKYDLTKYEIPNPVNEGITQVDRYGMPLPEDFQTPMENGDGNLVLAGKSFLKGVGSIADLPKAAISGLEAIAKSKGQRDLNLQQTLSNPGSTEDNIIVPDYDFISSKIPDTTDARKYLKEKTGLDLEPNPSNPEQELISDATEFAGAFFSPVKFSTAIKEANLGSMPTKKVLDIIQRYTPTLKKVSSDALTGLGIGTGSAMLKQGGVDPLTSDITASIVYPTTLMAIKSPYNSIKGFTTAEGRLKKAEKEVSRMLKERVGKDNIDTVATKLQDVSPLNTELMTAELAENAGLAGLHRAYAPNIPAIAEKNKRNNDIIKYALEELGDTSLDPYIAGDSIRNPLVKNLEKYKEIRAAKTAPLYAELDAITTPVNLNKTQTFLDDKYINATDTRQKTIDKIRKNLVEKDRHKLLEEFEKKYGHLSSDAKAQAFKQLSLGLSHKPAKVSNVIKELGDTIKSTKRPKFRTFITETRGNLISDIESSGIPQEKVAREAYAKYSKPVNAIEENPLLSKIIKKDLTSGNYQTPQEKIPGLIFSGSIDDTKELIKQIKKNKQTLDTLRGQTTKHILSGSELASADGNLSYPKLKKFLTKNKEKLGLIYTPEQLKVLEEAGEITRKRNFVDTFGRAKGSNTQSETTLMNNLFKTGGSKLLREAAAYTSPGGGLVYDVVKGSLDNAKRTTKDDLIARALLEPKTARELLLRQNAAPWYREMSKNYYRPLQTSVLLESIRNRE